MNVKCLLIGHSAKKIESICHLAPSSSLNLSRSLVRDSGRKPRENIKQRTRLEAILPILAFTNPRISKIAFYQCLRIGNGNVPSISRLHASAAFFAKATKHEVTLHLPRSWSQSLGPPLEGCQTGWRAPTE